jgi:hypothetical protein
MNRWAIRIRPLRGLGFVIHFYRALKSWANSIRPLRGLGFVIHFTQR